MPIFRLGILQATPSCTSNNANGNVMCEGGRREE